jgi:2-polyprenyl-3-methyl-5-hydroxy-6-metoxy-1,4-benzoquinol methylase
VDSCPICGSPEIATSIATRDRFVGKPGDFRVVECAGCGLARLSPRPQPDVLVQYYPESYPMYANTSLEPRNENPLSATIRAFIRNTVDRVHVAPATQHRPSSLEQWVYDKYRERVLRGFERHIPRHLGGGKVLDVGCGNPTFLLLMRRLGWEVAGLEPNQYACERANEVLGSRAVLHGKLSDHLHERGSFDYVHLSHVLEHLDDPISELGECFQLLKPGGIIYVETPNFASFGRKTFGTYWLNMDSPRHLFLFTPSTLARVMRERGFALESMTAYTWDNSTYPWEYTFELEDKCGELLPDRPRMRPSDSARELQQAYKAAIQNDSLCGDVLCLWGRRPIA